MFDLESKEKIQYAFILVTVTTIAIFVSTAINLDWLFGLAGSAVFIYSIYSLFIKDWSFILSLVLPLIISSFLEKFLENDFIYAFLDNSDIGYRSFHNFTIVLPTIWIWFISYKWILKKKADQIESKKALEILDKVLINKVANSKGKVEKIYIDLEPKYERAFYEVAPNLFIGMTKLIDNIIVNTKEPGFYGYEYAVRIFRIGNEEKFSWYLNR